MSRTLLAFALATVPFPAMAAPQTMPVSFLNTLCSFADDTACAYYVLGVVEGASFGEGRQTAGGTLCVAEGVTAARLKEAVKAAMDLDLKAFPEDRNLAAAGFIEAAAMRAFPCRK